MNSSVEMEMLNKINLKNHQTKHHGQIMDQRKNPALLPLEKLGKGLYFYEVDLAGTKGKSDKELLDLLKAKWNTKLQSNNQSIR